MQTQTSFLRDIEIAIRYQVSRPTVWRWVKQGKFPKPIKLCGGSTRWRLIDLEAWEQAQSQKQCDENQSHKNL